MVELAEIGIILQTIGVLSAATAAVIGVRSYINSNKRVEEAKQKEQETQLLALKTQQHNLETRQAQLFMTIYQQVISESFQINNVYLTQGGPKNYEEFKTMLMDPNKHSFGQVITFYEGVGVLVREGLLDIRLIALTFSTQTRLLWEAYSEFIRRARVDFNMPRLADQTEYLVSRLKAYSLEHPELNT